MLNLPLVASLQYFENSSLVPNSVSKLRVNRVMYCVWCNDGGHILDDGTIFRLGEQEYWLCTAERQIDWLLDSAIGYQVEVAEVTEQVAALPAGMHVELPGEAIDAGGDALVDTAAIIECVDLVITCDTAIAHLAGALARPTWVALKFVPDWRWNLKGTTTPWYPTVRLFRQRQRWQWTPVFAAMAEQLRQR